jgi:hypothetical protein
MKVTVRRQLTVSLENQVGRLAAVASALAARGVNLEALSVSDTVDQAVVRMLPSDPETTAAVLGGQGFHLLQADVLHIVLADVPGRLAQISTALAAAQINIDYVYGGAPGLDRAVLVFKVSNTARALEIIQSLEG